VGFSLVIGRIFGWTLVILAMLMASAEAVMALGTGAYSGLATADVWTLLVGQAPLEALEGSSNRVLATASIIIMNMPAWIAFGISGVVFVHACRVRKSRRRRFRNVN
jgi:hypothetical protein